MKKVLLLCLASAFMLSSCSIVTKPIRSMIESNMPKVEDTEHKSETEVPEKQKKSEPQTVKVFKIEGKLPEIGEFSAKTERFYKDYTPYFIPSKEYGKVIPYVGKAKVYTTADENYPISSTYSYYGFCTEDGKIVMDADEQNTYVSCYIADDGACFYLLSVTDPDVKMPEDDIYLPEKTVIIPESGEWCLEFDGSAYISQAGGGYINMMVYEDIYGAGDCIVYDYDGNIISRPGSYDSMQFSDNGPICVMRWNENEEFFGYIDISGEIVLGPYKAVNTFNHNGIANIEDEDGWYLINKNGERLTGAYRSISYYKKDYEKDEPALYVAKRIGNEYASDIYDSKANYITTILGASYFSLRFPKNGEYMYFYTDNRNQMVWKKLHDGSDFVSKELGVSPNQYSGNDDYFVYHNENTDVGYILDTEGETVLKIPDYYSLGGVSSDGRYFIYSCGDYIEYYDEQEEQWMYKSDISSYLYDTVKKESTVISEKGPECYAYFVGENEEYLLVNIYNEMNVFGDQDNCNLYDMSAQRNVFENCRNIVYNKIGEKGYFNVCTEKSCILYDNELNPIIKVYNE